MQQYTKRATQKGPRFSRLITITGKSATGTSTALSNLQNFFPDYYNAVSAGSVMRSFATEKGMTIEEFVKFVCEHPEEGYDKRCDDVIRSAGAQNFGLIEGRLSHVFAPRGYHVLLQCDLRVRAQRRSKSKEFEGQSLESVMHSIQLRDNDDGIRYGMLYPGCLWRSMHYDCVIDTGACNELGVVDLILKGHALWLETLLLMESDTEKFISHDICLPVAV